MEKMSMAEQYRALSMILNSWSQQYSEQPRPPVAT
jgi:hypothetical protein